MGKCKPCGLPGGDKNFHVCVDLSYRAPGEAKVTTRGPRPMRKFDNPPGDFNNWGSDKGSKNFGPDRQVTDGEQPWKSSPNGVNPYRTR